MINIKKLNRVNIFFLILTIATVSIFFNNCAKNESAPNETLLDADSDGIADRIDNCSSLANVSQSDINRNGVGDLCDSAYIAQVAQIILD